MTAAKDQAPSGDYAAIAALAVGQTICWAGMFYVFPALLLWWDAGTNWGKPNLTLAFTLALIAAALASPLSGRGIDKGFGPLLLSGAAALGGIYLASLSLVQTYAQFLTLWILIGICLSACLYEACFAFITRARGAKAKRAIVLITLVAGFAGTISFPAAHYLANIGGWQSAVQIFGACVVLIAAPLHFFGATRLERTRLNAADDIDAQVPIKQRRFLRQGKFWLLATGFALCALVHAMTLTHLLPLLADRGLPTATAVLAASCIGPMQVVGRLVMVGAGNRFSHHGFTLIAFALMALSVLMLLISQIASPFLWAFVLLFGGAYGTISILRPLVARDQLGQDSFGAKSGVLSLVYLLAVACAPYLGALIWAAVGYDAMLLILMGTMLIAAVLYRASHALS